MDDAHAAALREGADRAQPDHVPETPTDGTVLTHGTGALNDTGLQVTSTYHYSLFTVTNTYDKP